MRTLREICDHYDEQHERRSECVGPDRNGLIVMEYDDWIALRNAVLDALPSPPKESA